MNLAQRNLPTYRRVEIDKNRTRDIFTTAGLSEKGLERTDLANVNSVRIGTTIGLQAMLKQVPRLR